MAKKIYPQGNKFFLFIELNWQFHTLLAFKKKELKHDDDYDNMMIL